MRSSAEPIVEPYQVSQNISALVSYRNSESYRQVYADFSTVQLRQAKARQLG